MLGSWFQIGKYKHLNIYNGNRHCNIVDKDATRSVGIPYFGKFLSQLLYFSLSSLFMAWEKHWETVQVFGAPALQLGDLEETPGHGLQPDPAPDKHLQVLSLSPSHLPSYPVCNYGCQINNEFIYIHMYMAQS